MPELPEVETIRQDLKRKILNKKINKLVISEKARIDGVVEFRKKILSNQFIDVKRVGKLLIFVLRSGGYMLVHLKMTGQLIYLDGDGIMPGGHHDVNTIKELPNNSTRVTFVFEGGGELFFNDQRRFGYLKLVNGGELKKIKSRFGPEPLQPDFTLDNFKRGLAGKRTILKAVLLNQQVFAGFGNIYVDEICFWAGVRPDRVVNSISQDEVKNLYRQSNRVIKKAIDSRGTTFNDYVDVDGNSGDFFNYLRVYGRGGLVCKRCGGVIKKIRLVGRGTHFCPGCQF